MDSKNIFLIITSILVLFFIIIGIYIQTIPTRLYPGEIREYEGQDLSSINNFRENSIKGPQNINISSYTLTITGLVNDTYEYSYEEILNNFQRYQKVTTLHCIEGWSVKILWEGFLLKEILDNVGVSPESIVVIFQAYDGYSTSLPLKYIRDQDILLAYKMNDIILPPERGFPFQLVAESKYGYKWIKWITKIELSTNTDFRGYWEIRGFSNEADIE